ncbi:MAG: type II secretion system protein [Kosmotoga sp.]|jgi:prepilin-type N-terminal cleavage/methylation domain-containing protein|nr:MAG: type II secretion system protein [Kosmotoga sp.]
MKRKRGFSLTEILIVLAVSSIVLAIVAVVSSMTFKTSSQLNATMVLDEEITKLHTNMRYIVSQSWTTLTDITERTVEDATLSYVELTDSVPITSDPVWVTSVSTIVYLSDEKRVVHYYHGEGGNVQEQTLAEHVDDFSFVVPSVGEYVTYTATFTYYYDEEKTKPVTSKYTSGAVRFY